MGVSEGAVRKRVARGTLRHDKASDGRVYVYLDAGVDAGQDAGVDPNNSALISQLRDEVAYLREENRRKDEIIMQQAMTMRQLTAPADGEPPEPRESPETATDTVGREEPFTREDSPQEPVGGRESATNEQQGRGPILGTGGTQEPSERRP